jgi:methylglutaconyl-CoA hydratase
MAETIRIETDHRGVATLWLTRPDKHNALSGEMIGDLTGVAKTLAADDEVRVVILAGEGRSFCAGGDLNWMRAQMNADTETRAREARALAEMLFALNSLPKPLIGKVHGNAFGGGVGLMSVCDVAIAADHVKLGLTETKLGLIPATIGPYVIARMGEAKARRVFMSSRVFDAEEGIALGLVAKSVPPAVLDDAVEAEVLPYLSCAPGAVAAAKALARRMGPKIDDAAIDESVAALIRQWDGDEAPEGVAAFFEKRPAAWVKT